MKKQSEAKIQSDSVVWMRNNYCLKHHNPRCSIFSVPNEIGMEIRGILQSTRLPKKTIDNIIAIVSQRMKNMGMMSGVSDTVVVLPNGKTLFIEFKTPEGYQSPNQKDFQQTVTNLNHQYHVCRSLEQFQQIIKENV